MTRAERDRAIVAGYLAGVPRKRLAGHGATVDRALRRAGVAPNRRRGFWWPEAARLHGEGLGLNEIGRRLGRARSSVARALERLGLGPGNPVRRGRARPAWWPEAVRLQAEGLSAADAAARLGVGVRAVQNAVATLRAEAAGERG